MPFDGKSINEELLVMEILAAETVMGMPG